MIVGDGEHDAVDIDTGGKDPTTKANTSNSRPPPVREELKQYQAKERDQGQLPSLGNVQFYDCRCGQKQSGEVEHN